MKGTRKRSDERERENMRILIINGPNLGLLGKREPEVYGTATLKDVENRLSDVAKELGVDVVCRQSDREGEIVEIIGQTMDGDVDGIIINPAGYTHTSVAIRDAIEAVPPPTIEVHVSNVHRREEFRSRSLTAPACLGQVCGLGVEGYEWALRALVDKLSN